MSALPRNRPDLIGSKANALLRFASKGANFSFQHINQTNQTNGNKINHGNQKTTPVNDSPDRFPEDMLNIQHLLLDEYHTAKREVTPADKEPNYELDDLAFVALTLPQQLRVKMLSLLAPEKLSENALKLVLLTQLKDFSYETKKKIDERKHHLEKIIAQLKVRQASQCVSFFCLYLAELKVSFDDAGNCTQSPEDYIEALAKEVTLDQETCITFAIRVSCIWFSKKIHHYLEFALFLIRDVNEPTNNTLWAKTSLLQIEKRVLDAIRSEHLSINKEASISEIYHLTLSRSLERLITMDVPKRMRCNFLFFVAQFLLVYARAGNRGKIAELAEKLLKLRGKVPNYVTVSLLEVKACIALDANDDEAFHKVVKKISKTFRSDDDFGSSTALVREYWLLQWHINTQNISHDIINDRTRFITSETYNFPSSLLFVPGAHLLQYRLQYQLNCLLDVCNEDSLYRLATSLDNDSGEEE